jgi:N-acetylneuraminic acid mutarotase
MPTVRGGLSAAAVNGKIYAIGGLNGVVGSVVYLNTVEMYDPSSNAWSAAPPMPTARNGVAVVAVNGKIYALGGSNASIGSTNIVEVYDPSANTWNAVAPMPTARTGLAAATLNGKIYAIGGSGRVGGSSVFLSTVEVYDPSTDTWSVAAPMPTARNRLALAAVHGKIYAIGGAAGVVGNAVSVSTVEVYDPSTDTWTAAASMPPALDDLAASDANDLIYTLGGFANGIPSDSVNQYWQPATIFTFVKN